MTASLCGIHSRPAYLIKATRDFERKRIGRQDVDAEFRKAASELVSIQKENGFAFLSDGQLLWQDIFRPFCERAEGVRTGALTRWFENNTFFKQPVVVDELAVDGSFISDYFFAELLEGKGKAVLPGPYTFASLAENKAYPDKGSLMEAFASLLNSACKRLVREGFAFIQFNEPAVVYPATMPKSQAEIKAIAEAIGIAAQGLEARTCMMTFFGDFTKVQQLASSLPVDVIGIDFTCTPETIDSGGKAVLLGLADARNSLVETPGELKRMAESICSKSRLERFEIGPSCDLEFLPWQISAKKISALGSAAKMLGGRDG